MTTTPPQDIAAEQSVLGAMMLSAEAIDDVIDQLDPADFYRPAHATIYEAITDLFVRRQPVDAITVMAALERTGDLGRAGGAPYLHTLVSAVPTATSGGYYANIVREKAVMRRLVEAGMRIVGLGYGDGEPATAVSRAQAMLTDVDAGIEDMEVFGWPDGVAPEPAWVIPSLLAEDDRVMLTGGEGGGKTVLLRQLVTSVVVGKHPFLAHDFGSIPALHIDLENPRYISDNAYWGIRNRLLAEGIAVPDGLYRVQPRRFDVADHRDVTRLMRVIREHRPKLIAIGPLKNMTRESLNDEDAAVRVQNVLNDIRAESGAALVLEAHAGHTSRGSDGDWRPRGSSSFLGWPEFGFGMKPLSRTRPRAAQLVTWRGARPEDRYWPEYLVEGTMWPWVEDPRLEDR